MVEQIKELREKTGAGVMDAKKALEEAAGKWTKQLNDQGQGFGPG